MTDSRERETNNTCLTTNSTAETVDQCGKDNHNHHPLQITADNEGFKSYIRS